MEEKWWEPFERLETAEGYTLRLYGTEKEHAKVAADQADKILRAMREGWKIDIEYADIEGGIDIDDAGLEKDEDGKFDIKGYVSIALSNINGVVNFDDTSFSAGAFFWRVSFSGDAFFSGASFSEDAFFSGISFNGNAYFSETNFSGDAFLLESSFSGDTYFVGASFSAGAFFLESSFSGNAYFIGASFGVVVQLFGVQMQYPANFSGVTVREDTVTRGLWNYILCPLAWPIVWMLTIGKVELPKATVTDISTINTNTVIDTSSNPRLKRYIDDEQWINSWRTNPNGRWWREPLFRLWELTSHCGRSIGLWTFWSVIIAIVFAFIYRSFGAESITFNVQQLLERGAQPGFREYLYYSVVTFTTLGFGDIVPLDNWARFAVGAEVVLGYVMLGGLISIFANKFARRS